MFQSNGFYGHVSRNNLRSLGMFTGFLLSFQLVGAMALFIPLVFFDLTHSPIYNPSGYLERYVPMLLVVGSGYFIIRYLRHVTTLRTKLEFRVVDRQTQPRLVNIVENQALAAGLPLPRTGIIESPACNAFACGLSPETAVVVATRGLLEALDDDELAAVMAHEIVHIRNGDIRLIAAANILLENLQMLQRLNVLRICGWKTALLAVLFWPFLILSLLSGLVVTLAFTLARVSRLLISSSREFIADAEAVRMTHNPAAMISALRRIEGRSALDGLVPGMDAMMIDGAVDGALATHPTIAERVAVLTRLSGPMAHSAGPRRDTRTGVHKAGVQRPVQQRAVFGQRNTASPTNASPNRSLIKRVNAGETTNIFGITGKIALMLAIGILTLKALQVHWASKARVALNGAAIVNPYVAPETGDDATIRARREALKELQELAAANPGSARCFATERYRIGDRGLHEFTRPDPKAVEEFAMGVRESMDVDLDRYFGLRSGTVRAVAAADNDAELDAALLVYMRQRKMLLWILHRFFDEAGLQAMHEAYDSPEDREILEKARRRLDAHASLLMADRQIAAEMAFLVSTPEDFIPCLARLGLDASIATPP